MPPAFFDPPKPKYPFPPVPPAVPAAEGGSELNVWTLLPIASGAASSAQPAAGPACKSDPVFAELQPLPGRVSEEDPCMPPAERLWYGQVGVFEQDLQPLGAQAVDECQDVEVCDETSQQPGVQSTAIEGQASDAGGQNVPQETIQEEEWLDLATSWHLDPDQDSQKPCPSASSFEVVSSSSALDQLESQVGKVMPHLGAVLVDNVSHLKLPWEQGIYKSLFEDDPFSTAFTVPTCPSELPVASASHGPPSRTAAAIQTCKAFSAFKQFDDVSYDERMAKRAEVSLGKLVAFVNALPDGCKPEAWPLDYAACVEYLQASVGVRSALTIEKRSNSLVQYLRWASLEGITANLFSEATFWSYIQHLKRTFAPASRGPAVAAALRFAQHVLGVRNQGVLLSRRCLGALEQLEAAKGPVRQASPLLVSELLVLHGALKDDARPFWDRASAAYLLVCAYGRARAVEQGISLGLTT